MFSNVEFFKDGTYESDDANYDGSYSIEGDRIKFSGVLVEPVTLSYKIDGDKVKVKLTNASLGLSPSYRVAITGFEIAGADKKFVPAQARISANNEVTVWSNDVKEPVAVRYSFHNFRPGNLKNMFGIPVVPFRTDNWDDVM